MISIGNSIVEIVQKYVSSCRSYDDFINNDADFWVEIQSLLKNINIMNEYKPSMDYIHSAFDGYYPTYSLINSEGNCIEAPNNIILSFLNCKGNDYKSFIWESYLFLNLYRLLGWATQDAIYASRPVFSSNDIDNLGINLPAIEKLKKDGFSFEPELLYSDPVTIIGCHWWSPLKGLYQEICSFNCINDSLQLLSEAKEIQAPYEGSLLS